MATIKEFYKDFYGCTASVKHNGKGAKLTIRTPSGELIKEQTYKTRNGAMIALGRASDGWKFVSMTTTGKTKIVLR